MKLRNWINHNSTVVTCGAMAVLVGALCYLNATMNPTMYVPPTTAYYYDTVKNELFVGKVQEIAPIPTPAGSTVNDEPAGVRAYVFTCSSCGDASSRFVGYLETFTEESRNAQIRMNEQMLADNQMINNVSDPAANPVGNADPNASLDLMAAYAKGHLIAAAAMPNKWYPEGSIEASELISKILERCPNKQFPTQCMPDEK